MTYATAPITEAAIQAFVEGAQAKINAHYSDSTITAPTLVADTLQRYVRVSLHNYGQRSAYAFIEKDTGLILKPASWKVPAKHARGTIHTETHGAEFVGPYGPAYLR